jgi:DNA-binding PadR family transcriptional regulator
MMTTGAETMSVRHVILALLFQRPMYGYEIGKRLPPALQVARDVAPGQIANTLARMERAGWIGCKVEAGDGPDRKVFRLTKMGEGELREWYRRPEIRDYRLGDSFYRKLALGLQGGPVPVESILKEQRRKLYRELHDANEMRRSAGSEAASPWLLLLENAIAHLEADLRLIDMCEARLEELKAYKPPAPPPSTRGRPRKNEPEGRGGRQTVSSSKDEQNIIR